MSCSTFRLSQGSKRFFCCVSLKQECFQCYAAEEGSQLTHACTQAHCRDCNSVNSWKNCDLFLCNIFPFPAFPEWTIFPWLKKVWGSFNEEPKAGSRVSVHLKELTLRRPLLRSDPAADRYCPKMTVVVVAANQSLGWLVLEHLPQSWSAQSHFTLELKDRPCFAGCLTARDNNEKALTG